MEVDEACDPGQVALFDPVGVVRMAQDLAGTFEQFMR
jgi:hypothetical protein